MGRSPAPFRARLLARHVMQTLGREKEGVNPVAD